MLISLPPLPLQGKTSLTSPSTAAHPLDHCPHHPTLHHCRIHSTPLSLSCRLPPQLAIPFIVATQSPIHRHCLLITSCSLLPPPDPIPLPPPIDSSCIVLPLAPTFIVAITCHLICCYHSIHRHCSSPTLSHALSSPAHPIHYHSPAPFIAAAAALARPPHPSITTTARPLTPPLPLWLNPSFTAADLVATPSQRNLVETIKLANGK